MTRKGLVAVTMGLTLAIVGCDSSSEPPTKTAVPVATQEPKTEPPDPDAVGDDIDTDVLYAHGPMKLMMPEQILMSMSKLTGHDFGTYDVTNPADPDASEFVLYCRALGGCPDHVALTRNQGVGLVYVLTLDKAANSACIQDDQATGMIPPGADTAATNPPTTEIDSAIQWQYKHFLGVAPTEEELDLSRSYFESHLAMTDPDTGDPSGENENYDFDSALRGHCMALMTSARFIYH